MKETGHAFSETASGTMAWAALPQCHAGKIDHTFDVSSQFTRTLGWGTFAPCENRPGEPCDHSRRPSDGQVAHRAIRRGNTGQLCVQTGY